ncbi:MAG: prepilin-type N-terminal cleavage/methylation domain-containing protein [Omnitrophica bacterium]|nr:prepilin-type N-terminal cleavage/methylation domain-containing protein [Candidatus Omnitrophota bacterium]
MLNKIKKGLTLLELMVSIVLFLVVISGLLSTFVACMLLTRANSRLVIAAGDAQYLLEEVKALAYSDISAGYLSTNYPPAYFNNLDSESISFAINAVGGLKEVIVTVDWDEQGTNREFRLHTRIAP